MMLLSLLASRKVSNTTILFISIPLVLSAFTHLWNPIGFPSIAVDEGSYYLNRAMKVLNGEGPQYGRYDHPYFGWLFLAAIFKLIGYPDSLNPQPGDVLFFENLWLLPRVLMGVLAVVDTFLIYKIAERRYNRNVAFIAAILFAVMPFGWLTRRILLESIQLPLVLSSVLFCLYATTSNNNNIKKPMLLTIISGIFLGLAIFTKIPAFTMIPLVAFLIYANNKQYDRNKRLNHLGLWLIPVILIPTLWPAYAISVGEFDDWLNGILWQVNRAGDSIFAALKDLYNIDPVLLILGIVGLMYALIEKRDFFLLLFSVPYLMFLYLIGFVSYWHTIPLFPVFCIAVGLLIVDVSSKVPKEKIQKILPFAVISGIAIFGFINTTTLISVTNLNSYYFQVGAFLSKQISINNASLSNENKLAILGSLRYFWMIPEIFDKQHYHDYVNLYSKVGVKTEKVILVADQTVLNIIKKPLNVIKKSPNDKEVEQIKKIYIGSKTAALIDNSNITYDKDRYPYTNLKKYNTMPGRIEVKTNY